MCLSSSVVRWNSDPGLECVLHTLSRLQNRCENTPRKGSRAGYRHRHRVILFVFCCLWVGVKLMRKTYTILLTHVVVVGKTWAPTTSSSSSLSSSSFSSPCCQRRERRGKSWLSADGAPFGWMDGWMGGNGRWRNVWKTEVSDCSHVLYFQSAAHVDA